MIFISSSSSNQVSTKSTKRDSLNRHSLFELSQLLLDEMLLTVMNYTSIAPDDVNADSRIDKKNDVCIFEEKNPKNRIQPSQKRQISIHTG